MRSAQESLRRQRHCGLSFDPIRPSRWTLGSRMSGMNAWDEADEVQFFGGGSGR